MSYQSRPFSIESNSVKLGLASKADAEDAQEKHWWMNNRVLFRAVAMQKFEAENLFEADHSDLSVEFGEIIEVKYIYVNGIAGGRVRDTSVLFDLKYVDLGITEEERVHAQRVLRRYLRGNTRGVAKQKYEATLPSELSFESGDVIEVLKIYADHEIHEMGCYDTLTGDRTKAKGLLGGIIGDFNTTYVDLEEGK